MPNVSDTAVPQQSARRSNATKRLIQAAALASALIPLGAVAVEGVTIIGVVEVEGAPIRCTAEVGCSGQVGSYSAGISGTNLWKFFTDDNFTKLLYTLEISGTPDIDVNLEVFSDHVGVFSENYLIAFPNSECIPLIDNTTCVIFDVTASAAANWGEAGYYMEMRWFAEGDTGESLSKPADDGRNRIFKSKSGNTFDQVLRRPFRSDPFGRDGYEPDIDPIDPALGGRGDTFSRFIAGRADVADVPEPTTLWLLGTGLAATLYRRRRR